MNKKALAVGAAAAAGAGIYLYLRQQQNGAHTEKADHWSTADMPDLSGKIVAVTGANSGIGFDAAREFACKGAHTILACRSMAKAETALSQLKAEIPEASAEIMQLDLASLDSVRAFAAAFNEKFDRLNILVNNAGIMMVAYATTEDGFESQFGTNHLGHFALTGLLLEPLKRSGQARVVNISSMGHHMGDMNFDNLMYAEGNGYSPTRAYGRSKLANLLFTNELQRRFETAGIDAIAVAAHPGTSRTNLTAHLEDGLAFRLFGPLMENAVQSAEMGALPTLRAAVDPHAGGGDYFGPDGFMQQRGYPVPVGMSSAAQNESDARQLWAVSEQLTGVSYL